MLGIGGVSRLLCKRPRFVFGDGVPGKGAVRLPRQGTARAVYVHFGSIMNGPSKVGFPLELLRTVLSF
jgi:hypothetical protein